jgi:hypothetical protein
MDGLTTCLSELGSPVQFAMLYSHIDYVQQDLIRQLEEGHCASSARFTGSLNTRCMFRMACRRMVFYSVI